MKFLFFLILSVFLISCKKETLDPSGLKKVVLLQVDYLTYTFEGGKEFSYFENDTSTMQLPIQTFYPIPHNRLTILYTEDTIFDGLQVLGGKGVRNFPQEIDPQIHYFRNKNSLETPIESRFQTIFYDLGAEPIPYDSIWKNIANLRIADNYQIANNTSKIGLFLFRPSASFTSSKEDWKWYIVMKN